MRPNHRGMTLIELLVAMAIGVGILLAVSTMLVASENHKRTTTSTNDADQTGAYAASVLDRAVRGAGSALVESVYPVDQGILGCRLNAGGFLPRAAAFPPPFSTKFLTGTTGTLSVAPVLIAQLGSDGAGSDALVVMGGSGAGGGVSMPIYGAGSATTLILETALNYQKHDLVLVSQGGQTAPYDCLLEEVNTATPAGSPTTLNLLATLPYYTAGTTTPLTTYSGSTASSVTPIGNADANNVQFMLFGVSPTNTLYSYDLFENQLLAQGTGSDESQAVADGVVQMNAIYGVSTGTPGVFGGWAGPGDAGYTIAAVMASPAIMQTILAVRIALVVQGEYFDKNLVSPATLTIFGGYTSTVTGASLAQVVALTPTQQHYRFRVFEFTVPIRNTLIVTGGAGSATGPGTGGAP